MAISRLRSAGKVPESWLDTYRQRQAETKEISIDALVPEEQFLADTRFARD